MLIFSKKIVNFIDNKCNVSVLDACGINNDRITM